MSSEKEETKKEEGHLIEIFSSYQGEGGVVRGSCFGRRQIFIRFAGCNLNCEWCDTAKSRNPKYLECSVETTPGSWKFATYKNPVDDEFVIDQVLHLSTKDFHSDALTGGEPEYKTNIIKNDINKHYNLIVGSLFGLILEVLKFTNSVWLNLIEKELESISILNNYSVKQFAKLVVTEETNIDDVRMIADRIRDIVVPIVVQPVTPIGDVKTISTTKLFKITETIAEVLPTDLFGISIQGHKLLSIL